MRLIISLLFFSLPVSVSQAWAETCKCVDKDGHVTYSNVPVHNDWSEAISAEHQQTEPNLCVLSISGLPAMTANSVALSTITQPETCAIVLVGLAVLGSKLIAGARHMSRVDLKLTIRGHSRLGVWRDDHHLRSLTKRERAVVNRCAFEFVC